MRLGTVGLNFTLPNIDGDNGNTTVEVNQFGGRYGKTTDNATSGDGDIEDGDEIKKGDVFCVLESMKMQVSVKSHKDGIVKNIKIKEGNSVNKNDILAEIE